MRHIISVIVENKPGVLSRVSNLFSARGFNIESLAVGETEDPNRSRMTIAVAGDENVLEQVRKQLSKLIDTIKVTDFSDIPFIERDLVLIKLKIVPAKRSEIIEIANIFRGKIVDVSERTLTIEASGTEEKVNALIKTLRPYGISEMARTGRIAMKRGSGE
ncbi:MAG: acetolactate synthase small subunit [Planctomycetes bacterium]|nr:acetolactate synthase small subunit [Planctomycetota bacterium]